MDVVVKLFLVNVNFLVERALHNNQARVRLTIIYKPILYMNRTAAEFAGEGS